ncbi:MAG: hypothetical protein IT384_27675 [Deltaproteobacteria bacterium]|nr:hypothetical protein [Deltaproteobacteria bacterium]
MRQALFGLGLWALTVAAAPPKVDRLAVLPIIAAGPNGDASLSSVINDVSQAAAFRLGLRLLSDEEMFVASAEVGERVRNCGSDIACIADRLRAFDARYGLVVVVNMTVQPPLIGLQLIDTDERRLVGESLGQLAPEDSGISKAIQARARKIFDEAGYNQAGRVVVEVQPPQAKVTIGDFSPDEGAPNVFTVPPGHYEVRAQLDGYGGASEQAVAIGGQETKVGLILEEESSFFGSPWFWVGLGAVAAGGATAAVIAAQPTSRCVCVVFQGQGCGPCGE